MKINEIELEIGDTITVLVSEDDYKSFIENFDDVLESYEDVDEGFMTTEDFLEELFSKLGIEVRYVGQ